MIDFNGNDNKFFEEGLKIYIKHLHIKEMYLLKKFNRNNFMFYSGLKVTIL